MYREARFFNVLSLSHSAEIMPDMVGRLSTKETETVSRVLSDAIGKFPRLMLPSWALFGNNIRMHVVVPCTSYSLENHNPRNDRNNYANVGGRHATK